MVRTVPVFLHNDIKSALRKEMGMGKRVCRLDDLHAGQWGRIVEMHVAEETGQRLKDMGFVHGARIECVYGSPFGDPAAYFVKGTLIALRNSDAGKIGVEVEGGAEGNGIE